MYYFELPNNITSDNLSVIYDNYKSCLKQTEVCFNFANCNYVTATGIVIVAMLKDELNQRGIKTFKRRPKNIINSFIGRFGLFTDVSEIIQEERKNFLTLKKCINTDECTKTQIDIMQRIKEEKISKETFQALDYVLNEFWDNAGVHGYSCYDKKEYPYPIYFAGYIFKDKIELCIADRGQGIYNSLSKNNTKYKDADARKCLYDSIKNGVSGHPNKSPGFGLYCSDFVSREGRGSLTIWSSGYKLNVQDDSKSCSKIEYNIGTIIKLEIKKTENVAIDKILGYELDTQMELLYGDIFYE